MSDDIEGRATSSKFVRRRRDENRELALSAQGMDLVEHTTVAAMEEAQARALDHMLDTDASHDVRETTGRLKARLVIDLDMSWPEPPYTNPDAVLTTVESYILKALATHKYMSFSGIRVRSERNED
jgi:hypothetical protein